MGRGGGIGGGKVAAQDCRRKGVIGSSREVADAASYHWYGWQRGGLGWNVPAPSLRFLPLTLAPQRWLGGNATSPVRGTLVSGARLPGGRWTRWTTATRTVSWTVMRTVSWTSTRRAAAARGWLRVVGDARRCSPPCAAASCGWSRVRRCRSVGPTPSHRCCRNTTLIARASR